MSQKGTALILIGIIIFLIILGGGAYLLIQKKSSPPLSSNSSPVSSNTQANNQTGFDNLTNPPVLDGESWETRNIYLNGLKIDIPTSWSLNETERRSEPENANPKTGHDCADYLVSSNDDKALLYIKPACGSDLKIPDPAKNTIILKDYGTFKVGTLINQLSISAKLFLNGSKENSNKYQEVSDKIISSIKRI